MAAPSRVVVPRFLLPQSSRLWRYASASTPSARPRAVAARYASTAGKGKQIVLEKPAKFNPPSHGRRLPKDSPPKHYGGDLSAVDAAAQNIRDYPGMMSPKGSWSHWFLHSRSIHMVLTLGMLSSLAIYTFVENFKRNSPFSDLVPSTSDFLSHPFQSMKLLVEVFRLSTSHKSREVAEKRTRDVDDVEKRRKFRKAHGMPTHTGIAGWLGWNDTDVPDTPAATTEDEGGESPNLAEDMRKRKKFLGIF